MKSRYILIHHMYLVFGVSADHSPLLFQRVAAKDRGFALLDDQLVAL